MAKPRNIAPQIEAWQKSRKLSDAAAAAELELSPLLFNLWKSGTACPYAALLETKLQVPVRKIKRSPGGVITL